MPSPTFSTMTENCLSIYVSKAKTRSNQQFDWHTFCAIRSCRRRWHQYSVQHISSSSIDSAGTRQIYRLLKNSFGNSFRALAFSLIRSECMRILLHIKRRGRPPDETRPLVCSRIMMLISADINTCLDGGIRIGRVTLHCTLT